MDIRKISIGQDYKTAMHYIVGQQVLGGDYAIHLIRASEETGVTRVYIISKAQEVLLWKEFNSVMPTSIEYNISF
jgi:hypothetical protein